jgi:transcriptional regulator with XRE-family HTH domain
MDGKELKARREQLGLTQSELAKQFDVKPNTVARWENGVLAVPRTVELAIETVERNLSSGQKVKKEVSA